MAQKEKPNLTWIMSIYSFREDFYAFMQAIAMAGDIYVFSPVACCVLALAPQQQNGSEDC